MFTRIKNKYLRRVLLVSYCIVGLPILVMPFVLWYGMREVFSALWNLPSSFMYCWKGLNQ